MAKEAGSVIIDAPVEKVFDFVKDIGKMWGSFPGVAVQSVHQTPDGVGSSVEWASKMMGLTVFHGHTEYTEVVPNERIRAKTDVVADPTFLFTFDPTPEGGTTFTIEGDYHFDVPVVGNQIDHLYAKLVPNTMTDFLAGIKGKIEGSPPAEPGTLTREITIVAPVEDVFEVALDLGKLWTYFPDVAVRDVKMTPEGVGSSARIYTHMFGLHFEGSGEILEMVRNERIVVKAHFGPENPMWTFSFKPVASGTLMTVHGAWHVGIPRVGPSIETSMAKSHISFVEEMLANFKADLEGKA
ncbi:MAG TPA: SRPBCC family protein [Propionibacteriaceae bacterium]|nr:SRPBCC family protein [Propionibacteriaceae bacterium]